MDTNNLFRKGMVFGMVMLFVGAVVVPNIGGNIENIDGLKDVKTNSISGESHATFGRDIIYVNWNGSADYTTIQEGIDAANNSDTVFVYSGTYYENVVVDKTINLIGEDKDTAIIDGGGSGDVVTIDASTVNVNTFTVRNGRYGIYLNSSSEGNIDNCRSYGNYLHGIKFDGSSNCSIMNSDIYSNSRYGIFLVCSPHCNLLNCNSYNNDYHGFYMVCSDYTTITNCGSYNNYYGIKLEATSDCIITNCTSHDNSGYGIQVFDYSDNNTIMNCDIYDNVGFGIFLEWSSHCRIMNCSLHNTNRGIYLRAYSSNNDVINCDMYNNSYTGLCISDYSDDNSITNCDLYNNLIGITIVYYNTRDNQIHHNNFFDNVDNAYDDGCNRWDDGSEGNYWDDYTGIDGDGNGIGDMPYDIPGGSNQDRYPLMCLWPWISGDLDHDGDVDISDLASLLAHYGTSDGATYEMGDIDGDGDVDLSDLAALLANYGTGS